MVLAFICLPYMIYPTSIFLFILYPLNMLIYLTIHFSGVDFGFKIQSKIVSYMSCPFVQMQFNLFVLMRKLNKDLPSNLKYLTYLIPVLTMINWPTFSILLMISYS